MRGHPRPPQVLRAMIAAYLRGDKVDAIAAQFGTSKQYVSFCVRRAGYPLRGTSLRPKAKFREQAVELLKQGWTQRAVAEKFGVVYTTIQMWAES